MSDKKEQPNTTPPNIQALIKRATEIYEGLKEELEPAQNGRYVTVEVESGEHFLGDTREDSVKKAQSKYPNRITFTRKIGEVEKSAKNYLHTKHVGIL
jgi:hypothetical protein